MDNIKYNISRFLLPGLFLIGGLFLLEVALSSSTVVLNNGAEVVVQQDAVFLYASLFFILGSVIWFLYVLNLMKSKIGPIVMVFMLLIGSSILYYNYKTVQDKVLTKEAFEKRDLEIRQRMGDVKLAQQAYKEANGVYSNDANQLIDFVKNGKKLVIKKSGSTPERKISAEERDYLYKNNQAIDRLMTEREAALLAASQNVPEDLKSFIRDTSYIPVIEAVFQNEIYLEKRTDMGVMPFFADSLKYVPFSKNEIRIDTGSIINNEMRVPTLEFEMIHPMDTSRHYVIGDKADNHLRDSWSN